MWRVHEIFCRHALLRYPERQTLGAGSRMLQNNASDGGSFIAARGIQLQLAQNEFYSAEISRACWRCSKRLVLKVFYSFFS
jgi:hypothetical protein